MSADEPCPVCRWPGRAGVACGQCGWRRTSGPDPDGRLTDRQREHDLRAAGRAAGATRPVDRTLLAALAAIVRGGALKPAQIEKAMADAEQPATTRTGMVFTLARLVAGKTDAIAFVEIGPDAVSWQTLALDESEPGVPVPGGGDSREWPAILPALPGVESLRYLRMAGGVGVATAQAGEADPAALIAAARDGIVRVMASFKAAVRMAIGWAGRASDDPDGPSPRLDTVLVRRTRGWPVLEEAAARARAVLRPVTEIMAAPHSGSLARIVEEFAAQAPLRYGYDLILVEADRRTGLVRPWSHELFPAGTVAPAAATVPVVPVTRYAARQLALPIVARRGPAADLRAVEALAEQRPLIEMAGLDAATKGPFRVRVELARPGRAHVVAPAEFLLDAGSGGWPGLIVDLPERLWPESRLPTGALDLVLLVELGEVSGSDAVPARVSRVRGVVDQFSDVPEARIAVLGYRDHFGRHDRYRIGKPGQEGKALVVGSTGGFSTPDDLRVMMRRSDLWSAVPIGHKHAAPVEEALWLLTQDQWDWRPGARHVVLVVGRRPPHPPKTAEPPDAILPCTHGLPWRKALDRLRADQGLRCFAVLDDVPAPGYAANTWRELTASGGFRMARLGTTARKLARDLGLAPRSRAKLRLATLADTASLPAAGQEGLH